MKFSSQHALAGALVPLAAAFPSFMQEAASDPDIMARAAKILDERQSVATADGATAIFEPVPIFNAEAQYINVTKGSGHEYVPPGAGDLRGPCPGLNAFANHNFLPHDGYATIAQFVEATTKVVGMGPVLAAFLAVLGATVDGDGTAWSIAGTPSVAQAGVLGAQAHGLSGSHNKYESDASPTRPDLYQEGNDYKIKVNQFQQLIDMSPNNQVTLDSLTKFRSTRFDTQIASNPYFFNGPFTGVLVQPAAYTFIYRFMANHSAENPIGLLSDEVIASWFGVEGTSGNYKATQGTERIPDNWYRRAIEYPYETTYFTADALNAIALYPKFADIGGNLGKTNSFTGVDVANLTGGALNAGNLLQGNNLACLAYQFAAQAKPDLALNVINQLSSALGGVLTGLSCPQLSAIDEAQLEQFPGYTKST